MTSLPSRFKTLKLAPGPWRCPRCGQRVYVEADTGCVIDHLGIRRGPNLPGACPHSGKLHPDWRSHTPEAASQP